MEALRRFPFDTVLTPYNYLLARDDRYRADFDALAQESQARDVGLMMIKAISRNLWRAGETPRYTTWYEPLDDQRAVDAAVAFALARSDATGMCTAGDIRLLPLQVEAEKRAGSISMDHAEAVLREVPDLGSPFVRAPGRVVPEWLESLIN